VNAHAKACDCADCAKGRVAVFLSRIRSREDMVPKSVDATVPVRAHWRRHPNHLKKSPTTLKLLQAELARLMKGRAS
jgi:hypothetical protein